jgi:hypothetical protein
MWVIKYSSAVDKEKYIKEAKKLSIEIHRLFDFDEKNKCIIEEGKTEGQFDLFLWYPSYFKPFMKSKPGKFLNIEEVKEKMYTSTFCGVPFL